MSPICFVEQMFKRARSLLASNFDLAKSVSLNLETHSSNCLPIQ